jgi:hypothetical protein
MDHLSSTPMSVPIETRTSAKSPLIKRWFLVSLLVSTWVPIAFFILLAPSAGTGSGLASVKAIFLFLGTAHVPATLFFYTDSEFRPIIREYPFRYIYVPIFLTLITGFLFAFSGLTATAFLLLTYWSWQAFHYGRQNWGMYAFASIAETAKPPRFEERLAIDAGTLLAIAGTFKILGTAVAPAYLHRIFDYLYRFGFITFIGVLIFSIAVYTKFFKQTTVLKTIFFFTAVFFFVPIFVSTNNNIAFLSYAMAHGLQYIVFMSVISATATEEPRQARLSYKSLLKLGTFLLVVGFAFWRVGDLRQMEMVKDSWGYSHAADFLFGAVLGATMSHFVIDAGAWRLRMEKQRAYMSKRFYFLFD